MNARVIVLSHRAQKEYHRLPSAIKSRVKVGIDRIAVTPTAGRKLRGDLTGRRRFRVGDYRIIYEYDSKRRGVIVVAIRSHGRAYR